MKRLEQWSVISSSWTAYPFHIDNFDRASNTHLLLIASYVSQINFLFVFLQLSLGILLLEMQLNISSKTV
jgi:hypothetical protein